MLIIKILAGTCISNDVDVDVSHITILTNQPTKLSSMFTWSSAGAVCCMCNNIQYPYHKDVIMSCTFTILEHDVTQLFI